MRTQSKAGIVALGAGALVAMSAYTLGHKSAEGGMVSASLPALAAGHYQGICADVTPPEPDPCDAASGTLRYGVLGALVNVPYLAKWRAANPGEVVRLDQKMATPVCSTPASPRPQVMSTFFGATLGAIAEAIACARHPERITWPAANPAPTGTGDRTPPSAPGPITITPSG